MQLIAQRAAAFLGGKHELLGRHAGAFKLIHCAEQHRLHLRAVTRSAVDTQARIQPVGCKRHAQQSAALVKMRCRHAAELACKAARERSKRQHLRVKRHRIAAECAQLALGFMAVLLRNEQNIPLAGARSAGYFLHCSGTFSRAGCTIKYSQHFSPS